MKDTGSEQHSSHKKAKTVPCYICDKTVKEYRLSSHLFFGSLECRECQFKFRYCSKYSEFRKARDTQESESCLHMKLRYTRDPLEYLERKLRKDLIKSKHKVQEPSTREVIKEMTVYLSALRPLEDKSPWKYAIKKLTKYISRKSESKSCEKTADKLHSTNSKSCEKTADKVHSTNSSLKDKNEKHTLEDITCQYKSVSNVEKHQESVTSDEKSNEDEDSGEVGIPQHVEEVVISQAEWSIDNISEKEFEESNKSVTISLSPGQDTDIPLTVEAVSITKNPGEELVSLIVEDALYSSGSPAVAVGPEIQLEEIHEKVSEEIVEDMSNLLGKDEDAEDKTEQKSGAEEGTTDLSMEVQEDGVSLLAAMNENPENSNPHQKKSEEGLPQNSEKMESKSSQGKEKTTVTAYDDVESAEKVCINLKEGTVETNNNYTKEKLEASIPNLSMEYEENTNMKKPKKKMLASVCVSGNENTETRPLESFKERRIQYGKDDYFDKKQNSSQSNKMFKRYLEHQKPDRKSFRARDGSCKSLRDRVRRGKRNPYRKRDRVQGNALKIKKYNLRSRRHKPSEAFLQRLDAYEKKKLWEKLTPIARMLRKLTAEGNFGNLPALYLPIDSVEADDDFLVDVLLSQVFDIQQLRKMLMYVPNRGNDNEIAEIVDQVRKTIEQFSKTGDKPPVDILKPVSSQHETKCSKEERVKGRTESITKSLNRIIFGKSSSKKRSKTYYIDPPSDGNYYVVNYPSQPVLQECPMCYFRIFPAMFSLNLVTNLAMTKCVGCELIIYVVHESSDMNFLPKIIFKGEDVSENDSSSPMPARYKGLDDLKH